MSDSLAILLFLAPVLGLFAWLLWYVRRRANYVSPRRVVRRTVSSAGRRGSDALEAVGTALQVVGLVLDILSLFAGKGGGGGGGGFGGGGSSGSW